MILAKAALLSLGLTSIGCVYAVGGAAVGATILYEIEQGKEITQMDSLNSKIYAPYEITKIETSSGEYFVDKRFGVIHPTFYGIEDCDFDEVCKMTGDRVGSCKKVSKMKPKERFEWQAKFEKLLRDYDIQEGDGK